MLKPGAAGGKGKKKVGKYFFMSFIEMVKIKIKGKAKQCCFLD
jgi:hypothetical protein